MQETIILGIIAVLFAYLANFKATKWGLKLSFALIFLFLALRYDYGNDYAGYLRGFYRISFADPEDLYIFLAQYEPGWIALNWIFKDFGFFCMVAFLAFVSCVVYYRFIEQYVPRAYYWFAVFIYVFYPDFMLVHCSAMRQAVAVMIFIFSIEYLYNKKPIKYIFCVILATTFHYTAIVLLPVYLFTYFKRKISTSITTIVMTVYVALFILGPPLSPQIKALIGLFYKKYEYYQDSGVVGSGFGFAYYSILLLLVLYFEKFQCPKKSLIFRVAILSFMVMPLTLIIEMISRIGMYFAPATIAAYPNILNSNRGKLFNVAFLATLIFITIQQFVAFNNSDTYSDYFKIYNTVFSSLDWY